MHSGLPKIWRYAHQVPIVAAWVFLAGAGLWGFIAPPMSIAGQQPTWVTLTGAVLTTVGGFLSIYGAVRVLYWTEAVGALFVATGFSAYLLTVWALVGTGGAGRGVQAMTLTALILFMLGRAAACGVYAHRVRRAHSEPPEL